MSSTLLSLRVVFLLHLVFIMTYLEESAWATVGATTPFTTYEAEAGTLGGGATIVSLTSSPTTEFSSAQLEASGHTFVTLANTGDSVAWTNNTGQNITAINVRASIPSTANGSGQTATLSLYVNGTYRQSITLSSTQTWLYENAGTYDGGSRVNATGYFPHVFWDEAPTLISGAAVAPGSTIMLQKDSRSTITPYNIDCIDLENPPAPLSQPANSLSITSYGAAANNSGVDSTTAIQNCISAAQSQGKIVWVPQGIFYVNTPRSGIRPTGITIEGAGPWYSTIYHNVPLPSSGVDDLIIGKSCTIQNLSFDCNGNTLGTAGGSGTAVNMGGSNWLINNVWVHHMIGAWADGTNGTIENSRINNSWGDGINLNNVDGDNVGNNLTATNNFIRGCGDDGIAINSQTQNSAQQMQNTTVTNNTVVASWWAHQMGVYGGLNDVVQNNLLTDSVKFTGLIVGIFGTGASIQSAVVSNNTILRSGGNGYNQTQSAVAIGTTSPGVAPYVTNAIFNSNIVSNSLYGGIDVTNSYNIVVQNNVISAPALEGVSIDQFNKNSVGNGVINNNTVTNLTAGQPAYIDYASGYTVNTSTSPTNSQTEASTYNSESNVQTENCSEGGLDVGYLSNGSYTAYNNVNLNSITSFAARIASAGSGGTITVHIDSPTGQVIGTCSFGGTGGWQTWATQICGITGTSGTHTVYLVYSGGFNIEWFVFQTDFLNATEASSYNFASSGIQTETCSEGGLDVGYLSNTSYTTYNNVDLNGIGGIAVRVASAGSGGSIAVHLDSPTGTLIGTCTFGGTGGWETWATQYCSLNGASGFHNLCLVYSGGFNIEWFALLGALNETEASSYFGFTGVATETCSEGGLDVCNIQNASNTYYTNVNLNGMVAFEARVASAGAGGNIQIHLDSATGPLIGTCTVPSTGGWQTWTTVGCSLSGASGYHNVYLVFTGGSGSLFNLEAFEFQY